MKQFSRVPTDLASPGMPDRSRSESPRLAVAVEVDVFEAELLADMLFAQGASAVAESDQSHRSDRVEYSAGKVTLTADLDGAAVERLSRMAAPSMTIRILEPDSAWNNGWREFAKVHRCGQIVIRPAWLPPEHPAEPAVGDDHTTIELVMEPGESFGSGTHVTTRLCVEAVDRLVTPGATVLDVGSGTGVLGVAAALLGSGAVTAIDIDPDAVRVTRDLADANGVRERVAASTDRLADVAGRFDLVLANVLIPVIEELGADIVDRLGPGGRLVVSGVLVEHRDRTVAALPGLVVDRIEERDGWLLLEFARPPAG